MTLIPVDLTRTELTLLQETLDVTGAFEGRDEVRAAVKEAIRAPHARPDVLYVEEEHLTGLAETIVARDYPTSALRSKLEAARRP